MKSFPSTANESGNMYGGGKANLYTQTFDIERLTRGALNLNKSVPVLQEQLKEININAANFQAYPGMTSVINPGEMASNAVTNEETSYYDGGELPDGSGRRVRGIQTELASKDAKIYYENPLMLPADIIALAKDYDWIYRYRVKELASVGEKSGESLQVDVSNTAISPSMFNPFYGVNSLGIIRNTPLLNDVEDSNINALTSDCSIRALCALSKVTNSELGMARYKYADFMYCKDLGKVSNNHLITLRKFPHPVSDHIFEMASPKYIPLGESYTFETEGDVGRLITWFDTDDNKLEDIIKFNYNATWVEKNADIQQEESNADDPSTGIIGMISNAFNPLYNKGVEKGQIGKHSIWGWLGSQVSTSSFEGIGKNNGLLRNYDNNKVYTPKNTIQSTHLYEGKLVFSHEFTLNFSYQLRAYDNINPRSAFLDLIGNILEVTYRRGKFWGGSRKIIGPAQNTSAFKKVNNFIDNAWDEMGGVFTSLMNGGINFQQILGTIGSAISGSVTQLYNTAKNIARKGAAETLSNIGNYLVKLNSMTGFSDAAKGYLKNALGRPTLYAWNSILDGSPVGLWHVTIGNPRNPIMAIGNLILTNATISQSGPLGIDDFPSELHVSVTLKHATPRDVTDIGRMYTKGASAIYHVMAHHKIDDFWSSEPVKASDSANTSKPVDVSKNNNVDKESTKRTGNHYKEYKQDIATASKENGYYNGPQLMDGYAAGLPNPFLETDEHIKIMRTNNYSNHMLYTSIQEVA